MKRFWLFAGYDYYPSGGMRDFVDSFETEADAIQAGERTEGDWFHVEDAEIGVTVCAKAREYDKPWEADDV